jgi:hypothetical protein
MKKMRFTHSMHGFLIYIALLFLPGFVVSQIEYGGEPFARKNPSTINSLYNQKITLALSQVQEEERDYQLMKESFLGEALLAGFILNANIHPLSTGQWQQYGDSLRVWQMMIESPDAAGIGLVLRNFQLSENSSIYIYNPSLSYIIGQFNHLNNNDDQILSTQLIPGERLIIEYQERILHDGSQKMVNSSFEIEDVFHVSQGLTDLSNDKSLGSAGPCQININCAEGDLWQRQKRGVARILMRVGNSLFWCSGSLVNTTAQDGRPYFLTADHCGQQASMEDLQQWQFYFNFERPSCENTGMPYHNVLYGASLLASGPMLGGSDFKLLQLRQMPPPTWNIYYNGWNREDEPAGFGVGIHHPRGDAKKISTFDEELTSATPTVSGDLMAENSTWRVTWIATPNGHGVVEGGSSGSPLFNENGLIVGTLTGGSSSCNNTSNPDYYGKMSYHWDQNGEFFYDQLALWLDPKGTGAMEMPGYDPNLEQYPPPGFVEATRNESDHVEISWYKPGQTPVKPGWYSYVNTYQAAISTGPERATVFDAKSFNLSYPLTLSKVSHVFFENPANPWPDNRFRFKIYDHTGLLILYQSPVLEAESLTEMVYVLDEPLELENKFYVSVNPLHSSGNPSSVFERINYGNGVSFTGTPANWQVAGNNQNQYAFLTKIFLGLPDDNGNDDNGNGNGEDDDKTIPMTLISPEAPFMINNETEILISPRWAGSVLDYKLYKNNELLEILSASELEELVFIDESEPSGNLYDSYYLTVVYPGDIESRPSNKVFVFNEALCQTLIDEFPFTENFEMSQLPDCWTTESEGSNWQVGAVAGFDDQEIIPYEDNNFIYFKQEDESTSEAWLISPPFDISQLETPALSFWFNTNYNRQSDNRLEVYVSTEEGIFRKLWDAGTYPLYREENAFTWMKNLEDLSEFRNTGKLRIAFLVSSDEPAFAALDKIEIMDATEMIYPLTLKIMPADKGEVYGAGNFIAGQKVIVEASPNTGLFFHYWMADEEIVSKRARYDFIMPDDALELTAFFDPQSTVSVDEVTEPGNEIMVYPNPSRGLVNIYFPNDRNSISLQVFNTAGQLILVRSESYLAGQSSVELDLSQSPRGLYLIVIQDGKSREVRRVNTTN